jgi:hypothetical protein|tara:strand:- start:394 stop:948 length:555 start_codon:yes stop_codon:yes gene_type:complete
MFKKVISEIDIISGTVDSPKGFEIDRKKIKNDIFDSFINKKRISNNERDFAYTDYQVPFSQPLQWLKDYLRDHFKLEHSKTLIPKLDFGIILETKQQSHNRNLVEPLDLLHAPDYTCVYGVDIDDEEQLEVVIHYDDNRRVNRTWHVSLKNNKFIIFPSMQRFYITENKSKKLQTILISTYEYI